MSDLKPVTLYCCKVCQHLHHAIVTACDCGTGCEPFEYEIWEARRTQPEATAPAQDLSAAILAIPLPEPEIHEDGVWHLEYFTASQIRDMLKAAAALASSANALSGAIDKDAKIAAQRARIIELEEQLARTLETPVNDWCPKCHARESSGDAGPTDAELLDFVAAHPEMTLRHHKRRWSFVGFTNYEYDSFKTPREAIAAAILQSQKGGSHG